MAAQLRPNDVFINCPFGSAFKPIFEAIVFAISALGFVARCALEVDDASQLRLSLILEKRLEEKFTFGDLSEMISLWLQANR